MRYVNDTDEPRYCMHSRHMLGTLERTPELDCLSKALEDVLDNDSRLDILLSGRDIDLLGRLIDRHARTLGFDSSELRAVLDDPDGTKALRLRKAAEKSEQMRKYHEEVSRNKEFERMVKGETSEEMRENVRNAGRLDVSSMDVQIGSKPRNIREAMALNAKLDVLRKASDGDSNGDVK